MGRIQVLDQQTIDKIAAGEVVERPASVVKELVENAVDAGASQITVEIREGGIGFLRITDNGSGIDREDIPLAFLRHSTSKIRDVNDLEGVASLGFRGEALSSISAVSMVELITKTRESALGSRCFLEGGVQKSLEEIGAADGTTLIVRNLFYNVPARRKFLRSEMTEAAAVHETMTHLALSRPEISFKLFINGQMKLQTAGSGNLKDVIYHIYGRDVAMRLIALERQESSVRIAGYIGKPELSRGNRTYENYFVNGRYVKSKIIAKAVEDGYKKFLMQHRYPFVCLDIRVDGPLLDVNVHPAKMEIRFGDQNLIYEKICQAVRDALSGRELIPEVTPGRAQKAPKPESRMESRGPLKSAGQSAPSRPSKASESLNAPAVPKDQNLTYFMEQMRERVQSRHAKGQTPVIQEENGYQPFGERKEATPPKEEPLKEEPSQLGLFDGKLLSKEAALQHMILGQLFDTYWLVQYGDKLYIIDQHAAHEKVLYERLMRDLKKHAAQSQLLSPPIVLPMSMQEERLYLKYQQYFADMGFEIEAFGDRTYAARAVPSHLPGIANSDLFMELLDSLSDLSGSASSETLQDKIASMSCKAAVKGKRRLSSLEAKALIDELLTLENPYHCPHGRPTIISMSKYELEKKFKRIV